jgi:SOS-response transcriptional repressor LexA
MTHRELQALKFITAYMVENEGVPPSFEEMRSALGYSSKSHVFRLLNALERQGKIRREHHRARAIQLVDGAPYIPLSTYTDVELMIEAERRWPGIMALKRLVDYTA